MIDDAVFNEVSGMVQAYVRKYGRRLSGVDLEQELNLALLLMIRANPEKTFDDLTKMASKCLYRATIDIIRARAGRGTKHRPRMIPHPDPTRNTVDLSDPANLAAIQEAFNDLRSFGHAESVVLDALVNPSPALQISAAKSKRPRVTVSLPEIMKHYGVGMRGARRAVKRIKRRLTRLVEE